MADEKQPAQAPQGPGLPVLPEDEPADAHYNPQPKILHANADYSAIVDEDHPDAAFVINPDEPGSKGAELLKQHRAAKRKAAEDDEEPKKRKTDEGDEKAKPKDK